MGVSTRKPWLTSLGVVLAGATLCAGAARAQLSLSSDTPGSIAVFPKVIADNERDSIIMLTNTSNMPLSVKCWYFDANNLCQKTDFFVDLTPRQPTWWRVSSGRNAADEPNIFHGAVPIRIDFRGELKCVEVDDGGFPLVRNALKGEAILITKADGQVSEYNAIMFQGGTGATGVCQNAAAGSCLSSADCCPVGTPDCGVTCRTQLLLDGTHYAACPDTLQVAHYAEGAQDFSSSATVRGELTLVPCAEDINNERPIDENSPEAIAQLRVVNEYEEGNLSASVPVACWANVRLCGSQCEVPPPTLDENLVGTIYAASSIGPFVKTRIETSNAQNGGLLGVFEEFHTPIGSSPVVTGTAAVNFHNVGARTNGDVITIEDR